MTNPLNVTETQGRGMPGVPTLEGEQAAAGREKELAALEGVIQRNLRAFYEVGAALMRIRDGRLYRGTHETFEKYCRERWEISRPRAYELVESSKVVENLSAIADKKPSESESTDTKVSERTQPMDAEIILPQNEAQARPLSRLPAELQREVWQKAVATAPAGRVTARHVQNVVRGEAGRVADREIKKARKRMREDRRMTEEFTNAVNALLDAIDKARKDDWRAMTKEIVIEHLEGIQVLIEMGG